MQGEREHLTSIFRRGKEISMLACKYTDIVIRLVLDFCFSFGLVLVFLPSRVCLEISNSAVAASVTQSWFFKTGFGVCFVYQMNCLWVEFCTNINGWSRVSCTCPVWTGVKVPRWPTCGEAGATGPSVGKSCGGDKSPCEA